MSTGVVDEKLATWKFLGDPAEVGEAEPLEEAVGCKAGDDVLQVGNEYRCSR